jgi:uncharacterized membrane protein YeaQ/YmgE (transglycosylase-associated protein family)
MFSLISWAVFGAIVGGVAKALMPGKIRQGWVPAIGIGIAGSIIGGLPFGDGPAGIVGSVLGAVLLVYVLEAWRSSNG